MQPFVSCKRLYTKKETDFQEIWNSASLLVSRMVQEQVITWVAQSNVITTNELNDNNKQWRKCSVLNN